ncbi:MAG: PQQ-like beta-propeller repeat protein [Verrucomicrobia bacterium]|nr:PQQ-like beta-propeller repeat protein [Verrucomicrobiota bacterium]
MTQHGFVRGLFVVLLMATVPGGAAAADWPRWRGPELNGISRETGWLTSWPDGGPKVLWKARVGTGFSSFAIAQGRAYTMGNANDTDSVFCFDAATGRVIWRHDYPAPLDANSYEGGTSATPTVDGDRVYTLSKRGVMFCLDAAKGTVIWTKPLAEELGAAMPTWGFAGSVLVEGDLLLVNVGSTGTALQKDNGTVVWSHGTGEAGYATPVPFTSAGTRAAVLFTREHVVAVTVADGKELWRYPWKTRYDVNAADPILAGDQVFVSSGYNRGASVIQITGSTAEKVWENRNMRNHFNSCVRWEGHLYGVDETELRCLVWDTGEVKWSDRKFGKGSLMLADGHLIALSEKGELMVAPARPTEFKPLARAQVIGGKCWTTPVLANGRIYCRNAAGDVVCVDVRGQ